MRALSAQFHRLTGPETIMPRYISHEHRFILYTNRKCATMSIKAWVRQLNGLVQGAGRRDFKRHPEFLRAAVVRNPFDRVISSWGRAKCTYEPGIGGKFGIFQSDIWGTSQAHLQNFLTECASIPDPHWKPQVDTMLDRGGNLIPTYLIRMENFQPEWDAFCDLVRLPHFSLTRENSRHEHENPLKIREYEQYHGYFTAKMRARTEQLYRRDLELLGYSFES